MRPALPRPSLRFLMVALVAAVVLQTGDTMAQSAPAPKESVFRSASSLSLGRLRLTAEVLERVGDERLRAWLTESGLAISRSPVPTDYDLAMDATALPLPSGWETGSDLPDTIERAQLNAQVSLAEPWSRRPTAATPRLTAINVKSAAVDWGVISAIGNGDLTVDETGLASGMLRVTLNNWRDAVALASDGDEAKQTKFTSALEAVARGNAVTIPVTVEAGVAKIGPIVVGRIPPLLLQ